MLSFFVYSFRAKENDDDESEERMRDLCIYTKRGLSLDEKVLAPF